MPVVKDKQYYIDVLTAKQAIIQRKRYNQAALSEIHESEISGGIDEKTNQVIAFWQAVAELTGSAANTIRFASYFYEHIYKGQIDLELMALETYRLQVLTQPAEA